MKRIQKLKFYLSSERRHSGSSGCCQKCLATRGSFNEEPLNTDTSNGGQRHINNFPEEILLHMFSFLTPLEISLHVMPVCRLWHRLAQDSRLWTELSFDSNKKNKYGSSSSGSGSFMHVRSLVFRGYQDTAILVRTVNSVAVSNANHLTELWLFNCFIPTTSLAEIGKTCPNIKTLTLVKCREDYTRASFNRKFLRDCSFLSSYNKLQSLSIFRTLALATFSYEDAQVMIFFLIGPIKNFFSIYGI